MKLGKGQKVSTLMLFNIPVFDSLTLMFRGAWLTQSEKRATLDLGVVDSNSTLGAEIT